MLTKKLDEDLKKAMKEKDNIRVSVLRMLKTAVNNKAIELKVTHLKDADVMALIRKDVKRHQESIVQFKKGNREDLVQKEEAELNILRSYLPKEPSAEELKEIIKKVIAQTEASGKRDFGKAMKAAIEKLGGAADGKTVSTIVNELLNNP